MAKLTLFEKLEQIEARYNEMTRELSSPEVHADSARYQKLAKTHSELGEIVAKYREWKEIEKGIEGAKQLFAESDDAEMKQMAHDEQRELESRRETVEREVKLLLVPKDPNDDKDTLLEVKAGEGGEESALFASDLLRMYLRYAERHGWKTEIIDSTGTGLGGINRLGRDLIGRDRQRLRHCGGVDRAGDRATDDDLIGHGRSFFCRCPIS